MLGKTFGSPKTIDELNLVNDAQKALFGKFIVENASLMQQRVAAYLQRWREALVFVEKGSSVLDVGGGGIPDPVWSLIADEYGLDYHFIDIDPNLVRAAAARMMSSGLPAHNARMSSNTELLFDDRSFDFVFSSHCIEHSNDLSRTFSEIHRVLRPTGSVFFSVPFGFDNSDEHLLSFDVDHWLHATELGGFEIVNYHLGKTYAISTWDLSVYARPRTDAGNHEELRMLEDRHSKRGRTLVSCEDRLFTYSERADRRGDCVIEHGVGASFTADDVPGRSALLLRSHDWSGIVRISNGVEYIDRDLFSRYNYTRAIDVSWLRGKLDIECIGRNPASTAFEVTSEGMLVKA